MTIGAKAMRKKTWLNSGTLSPNPWDLTLLGRNVRSYNQEFERRIGLRRDAPRAPIRMLECHRAASLSRPSKPQILTRSTLTYSKLFLVLTKGSTLLQRIFIRA